MLGFQELYKLGLERTDYIRLAINLDAATGIIDSLRNDKEGKKE